jgi:hypothetical protein
MPTQTGARADAAPTFNVLDRAQQEQVNRLSDEAATNRGGWGAAACAAATGPAWGFMTAEEMAAALAYTPGAEDGGLMTAEEVAAAAAAPAAAANGMVAVNTDLADNTDAMINIVTATGECSCRAGLSCLGLCRTLECAICQDDFKRGDLITFDSCENTHVFHSGCLKQWLGTAPITPIKTKSGRVPEYQNGRRCPVNSANTLKFDHLLPGVALGPAYESGDQVSEHHSYRLEP